MSGSEDSPLWKELDEAPPLERPPDLGPDFSTPDRVLAWSAELGLRPLPEGISGHVEGPWRHGLVHLALTVALVVPLALLALPPSPHPVGLVVLVVWGLYTAVAARRVWRGRPRPFTLTDTTLHLPRLGRDPLELPLADLEEVAARGPTLHVRRGRRHRLDLHAVDERAVAALAHLLATLRDEAGGPGGARLERLRADLAVPLDPDAVPPTALASFLRRYRPSVHEGALHLELDTLSTLLHAGAVPLTAAVLLVVTAGVSWPGAAICVLLAIQVLVAVRRHRGSRTLRWGPRHLTLPSGRSVPLSQLEAVTAAGGQLTVHGTHGRRHGVPLSATDPLAAEPASPWLAHLLQRQLVRARDAAQRGADFDPDAELARLREAAFVGARSRLGRPARRERFEKDLAVEWTGHGLRAALTGPEGGSDWSHPALLLVAAGSFLFAGSPHWTVAAMVAWGLYLVPDALRDHPRALSLEPNRLVLRGVGTRTVAPRDVVAVDLVEGGGRYRLRFRLRSGRRVRLLLPGVSLPHAEMLTVVLNDAIQALARPEHEPQDEVVLRRELERLRSGHARGRAPTSS